MKMPILIRESGLGPDLDMLILHFEETPKWYWCCCSEDQTLSGKVLKQGFISDDRSLRKSSDRYFQILFEYTLIISERLQ